MITSHRDRRAFQNYGYFSRSCAMRHMISTKLAMAMLLQSSTSQA